MSSRLAAAALLVAFLLTACTMPVSDAGRLILSEFTIDGTSRLEADAQTVRVENLGEFPHTLLVADASGEVVSATNLIQPGEMIDLDLGLKAGTYMFTCRIVAQKDDGSIVDHYESGMVRVIEVVSG